MQALGTLNLIVPLVQGDIYLEVCVHSNKSWAMLIFCQNLSHVLDYLIVSLLYTSPCDIIQVLPTVTKYFQALYLSQGCHLFLPVIPPPKFTATYCKTWVTSGRKSTWALQNYSSLQTCGTNWYFFERWFSTFYYSVVGTHETCFDFVFGFTGESILALQGSIYSG